MAMKTIEFTKDKARLTSEKLKAKLVDKFGATKIGDVMVRQDRVMITADLTAAQWDGLKTKLEALGYFMELDLNL